MIALTAVSLVGILFGLDWGLPRPAWFGVLEAYRSSREPVDASERANSKGDLLPAANPRNLGRGLAGVPDSDTVTSEPGGGPVVAESATVDPGQELAKYVVGSKGFDEVAVLVAVRHLLQVGHLLDPGDYRYGGAHLYPITAALGLGAASGWLQRSVPDRDLPRRSEQARRAYLLARSYGALLLAFAAAAAGYMVFLSSGSRALAFLFLICVVTAPLTINYARNCKPYAGSTAWVALALIFAHKYHERRDTRMLVAASVACGLSVGGQVTNAPVALLPTALVLLDTGPLRAKVMRLGSSVIFPILLTVVILNPYMLTDLQGFVATVRDHGARGNEWGYGFRVSAAPVLHLVAAWVQGMGIAAATLSCVGLFFAAKDSNRFFHAVALTAPLGLILAVGFFHENSRFAMYLLPMIALLACRGAAGLWSLAGSSGARTALVLAIALLTSASLAVAAESAVQLQRERSGAVEAQVRDYLLSHDLRGRSILCLSKLRPQKVAPLPLFGPRWHVMERDQFQGADFAPELLVASRPVGARDLPVQGRYVLRAAFGLPESRSHRFLSYPAKWFACTYLYERQ